MGIFLPNRLAHLSKRQDFTVLCANACAHSHTVAYGSDAPSSPLQEPERRSPTAFTPASKNPTWNAQPHIHQILLEPLPPPIAEPALRPDRIQRNPAPWRRDQKKIPAGLGPFIQRWYAYAHDDFPHPNLTNNNQQPLLLSSPPPPQSATSATSPRLPPSTIPRVFRRPP